MQYQQDFFYEFLKIIFRKKLAVFLRPVSWLI